MLDSSEVAKKVSNPWRPIEDLEDPPEMLAKPELRNLAEIWTEQRQLLEDSEGLQTFNERLRREWAIETGLLERLYTFDRGVTQLLIERGVDASLIPERQGQDPNRIVAMIRDHEAAIDGLFDFIKGNRPLTVSYIKELHSLLTRNQQVTTGVDSLGHVRDVPLVRGAYKTQPNNPTRPDGSVHEYCPPEHVAAEMDRLVEMQHQHDSNAPEVEAAWLHHRFTQIHPFQDGNGRVARCLATLVFLKEGLFPLVIRDTQTERTRYLDALLAADHGDLSSLVAVFAASQKRALVQALGISGQVLRLTRAEQIVHATRDVLAERERARRAEWEQAKHTARALEDCARERFEEVVKALRVETSRFFAASEFFVDSEREGGERSHYFRWQIIETAKQLDYFANTSEYRSWVRIVLKTDSKAEILVSFHGTGYEYRGILAASACFFRREETDEGEWEIADVTPLVGEIFQINYREPRHDAEERFRDWIEEILVKGLEIWRAGL